MKTEPVALEKRAHRRPNLLALGLLSLLAVRAAEARAQATVDAGTTGFDVKRPVLASACEHGCPWGELGDYVKEAIAPFGYEVILCRNCNRDQGPPLVATAGYPPPIGPADPFVGTTTRVSAPVDFGVTERGLLAWAYSGRYGYASSGTYSNLRLIAKIEDPTYLLVAVKKDSSITDLAQIAAQHMAVKIIGGGPPIAKAGLHFYGLTPEGHHVLWRSLQKHIIPCGPGANDVDDL